MTEKEWLGEENQLGQDIWQKKYQQNGETFEEWLERVSAGNKEIAEYIREKKFLFGGRILSNRGLHNKGKKITYSNCYVITPPEDNLESIFDCAKKLARTYSYGGGCGIDISGLSPKGAHINNAAKETSGSVSFMELYSMVTALIGQNGRRGALMISLDCSHPDIEDFIGIKTDLEKVTKANISIRLTDDFMNAVAENKPYLLHYKREATGEVIEKEVNARELFFKIAETNWDYAEPGALFWDRVKGWNLLSEMEEFSYAGVNPCVTGDTLILTDNGYQKIKDLVGQTVTVWNGFEWSEVQPKITGHNQKMLRIQCSDGSSLDCTLYHKFILENGDRIEAKDLSKGMKLQKYRLPNMKDEEIVEGFTKEISLSIESITPIDDCKTVYCFNERKNHSGIFNGIMTAQCAEEPLPAGGSCLLGSINLSEFVKNPFTENAEFDFDGFNACVKSAVRALNEVLDEGLPLHPLKEQRDSVKDWRQIGLGIMGLADALLKMGITYGNKEAVVFCDRVGFWMADTAIRTSAYLAKESSYFPKYQSKLIEMSPYYQENAAHNTKKIVEKYGLRNSQLLTIAPTGTLSTMLGISGGIEPIYANYYERKTESLHGKDVYYKVYTPIVKQYMDAHGITDDKNLPDYFVTAMTLDYHRRIAMQSIWQKHIDASISSTVNVPNDFTKEDVFNLYMEAYKNGLKGITIFRDGCKRLGILSTDTSKKEGEENHILKRGEVLSVNDDLVGKKRKLITGCGSLHCLAYFDPKSGDLQEVYLSKGSTGGCNNFMVGLSRMISISARAGVSMDDIIDQLNSSGSCPSYTARKATKGDTSKGACCPMAVGNALRDMYEEMQGELGIKKTVEKKEEQDINDLERQTCPECGELLVFEEGCNICKACGWSKCL